MSWLSSLLKSLFVILVFSNSKCEQDKWLSNFEKITPEFLYFWKIRKSVYTRILYFWKIRKSDYTPIFVVHFEGNFLQKTSNGWPFFLTTLCCYFRPIMFRYQKRIHHLKMPYKSMLPDIPHPLLYVCSRCKQTVTRSWLLNEKGLGRNVFKNLAIIHLLYADLTSKKNGSKLPSLLKIMRPKTPAIWKCACPLLIKVKWNLQNIYG